MIKKKVSLQKPKKTPIQELSCRKQKQKLFDRMALRFSVTSKNRRIPANYEQFSKIVAKQNQNSRHIKKTIYANKFQIQLVRNIERKQNLFSRDRKQNPSRRRI